LVKADFVDCLLEDVRTGTGGKETLRSQPGLLADAKVWIEKVRNCE
jgi:hypothetical protein